MTNEIRHSTGAIINRKYSWRPDIPDHRDQIYTARVAPRPVVERIGLDYPIENQGSLGSCTGHSSTAMLEINLGLPANSGLSRLMAYYNGRELDDTVKYDAGAQIRSVIKGLVKTGVCEENLWPYKPRQFAKKPSEQAYASAAQLVDVVKTRKLKYKRVLTLGTLLACLSTGKTVTFGFMVPSSIDKLPKSAILRLPSQRATIDGGHAVVAVGYDMEKEFVWVRNSWGKNWGIDGYFKMPFDWFKDPRRLTDDMWTIG